jgi:hypothetical protein
MLYTSALHAILVIKRYDQFRNPNSYSWGVVSVSGGVTSYFGFEYQIYVTALMMLLHHQNSTLDKVVIETEFGDDADFNLLEAQDVKTLDVALGANELTLNIQIKTKRHRYEWQPNELRDVLLKQDEGQSKISAVTVLDRLAANTNQKFLFVTNGKIATSLSPLLADLATLQREIPDGAFGTVRELLINSAKKDDGLRQVLSAKLNDDLLRRIFLIEGPRMEDVKPYMERILYEQYWVPADDARVMSEKVVALVRDCTLRQNRSNQITAAQLEEIVGKPEIHLPYRSLQNKFVSTSYYQKALTILESSHLVILAGEPGVGKTTIARILANLYAEKRYHIKYAGSDANLEIMRACREKSNRFYLLDDILGIDKFDPQNAALGNQLKDIADQLDEARGRVKVVITVRKNVLAEAMRQTRLDRFITSRFGINVPNADNQLKQDVLVANLREYNEDEWQYILSTIDIGAFESLLHVFEFSRQLRSEVPSHSVSLQTIFEISRPSAYKNWIATQSDRNRVLMYTLWSIIQTNRFAWEEDLQRLFDVALECTNAGGSPGVGTAYEHAMTDLKKYQERIVEFPNGSLDFVHPALFDAVRQYLEADEIGASDFINRFASDLATLENPLDQSIAVMLVLKYHDRLLSVASIVSRLSESRYIQVGETIIRLGGEILWSALSEQLEEKHDLYYEPFDCRIDEKGHLVVSVSEFELTTGLRPFNTSGFFDWERAVDDPELQEQFNTIAAGNVDLSRQNPLVRAKFGRWLYYHLDLHERVNLFNVITVLSTDPISFGREAATQFFHILEIIDSLQYQPIFRSLCTDNDSRIKISMLEKAILPNWRFQPKAIQEEWIKVVTEMLGDPSVRLHSATGLMDMSGTHADYHAEHSAEQKKQWFIAVVPTLLQYEFDFEDSFSRLLSKYSEYFSDLPFPLRADLLRSIAGYIKHHPEDSEDRWYTIERLVLDAKLNQVELDIVLDLIQSFSTLGRARIYFAFAREYGKLEDQRYKDFVHRAFYNEEPHEYMAERNAALLGFLANASITTNDLPVSVGALDGDTIAACITRYVQKQDASFKKLTVLMAYGYGEAGCANARRYDLYKNDLILSLVQEYARATSVEGAIAVADAVLVDGYYAFGQHQRQSLDTGWYEVVKLFLYNQNADVCKRVCELVFAANLSSSVHMIPTYLMFVYQFLTHPIPEVQTHAFELFDAHLNAILDDLSGYRSREDRETELELSWFSEGFQEILHEKSSAYRGWMNIRFQLKQYKEQWNELSDESRQSAVEFFCYVAYLVSVRKVVQDKTSDSAT